MLLASIVLRRNFEHDVKQFVWLVSIAAVACKFNFKLFVNQQIAWSLSQPTNAMILSPPMWSSKSFGLTKILINKLLFLRDRKPP